ncbi:hypothetical protein yc1106_00624 [Curvularia clavata]|uniref:Uncharacterized protein n=1 Tax=Curvularia clavata TaxID=95742 RepID=A0A9Q8Z0L2_CURCL|nr:hypothetical protein yc1106_00624 [Curvularia clavata]
MDPTSDKEMLSNRDTNDEDGRMSKGSNRPGLSRSSDKPAPLPPISSDFPAIFHRGITSMLRTETELGDLGDIVFGNLSGSSSGQYHTQWHGASSGISATSSMSNLFSRAIKPLPGYSSSSSTSRGPTGSNGPQYGSPPAMSNPPSSSLPGMIENHDRDPNRLQSTTYTVQSLNSAPGNRSHTNLRHAHNLRPHNLHTCLASHRGGPRLSTLNSRSTSSALNDNIGLSSQASQNFEGPTPSTGGYTYAYANTRHPHNSKGQLNKGQGQLYHGPGQPHNLGQMRFRLPHQSLSQSLKDRHGEMEPFPPLDDTAYDDRSASLHASKLQSRRNRSESKYVSHRSETVVLPTNHKQTIAAEQADSKRLAAGPLSSNSTYLRTNSDALSCDTTSSPVSNDGRSTEVLRQPGDMEEMKTKNAGSYPSDHCFPAADSMHEAARGDSTEKMTDKTTSNSNLAAGQSKMDRVSGGPAGFRGECSDAPIEELCGDGTPSERHGNVSECAVNPTKPSPLAKRATSDRAQKPWGEQSSKSCTGIPDVSPSPARPGSGKDREGYPISNPKLLP